MGQHATREWILGSDCGSCYITFYVQCWGHVALRGNATATTSLKRNYTYLGEWQGGAALDEFHKITSYAYARARRFLRYLGVEGTVAGQGSESLLVRQPVTLPASHVLFPIATPLLPTLPSSGPSPSTVSLWALRPPTARRSCGATFPWPEGRTRTAHAWRP